MKAYFLVACLIPLSTHAHTHTAPVNFECPTAMEQFSAPANDFVDRQTRTVNIKVLKNKRNFLGVKHPKLITEFKMSGVVPSTKYNDDPTAFAVPIVATTEHSYASKILKNQGEVIPATVTSGLTGCVVLSDASAPGLLNLTVSSLEGFYTVDESDYNPQSLGNIYNAPIVEMEKFTVSLKEGVNIQKFVDYTIISDVSPVL